MGRRIVIIRHGERVDYNFGHRWYETAVDSLGQYKKPSLNMPDTIIARKGGPSSYRDDCPLTQIGHLQSHLVGKELLRQNVLQPGFQVYVSPALRTLQTAVEIVGAMGLTSEVKLKVEPGLFEWMDEKWYTQEKPQWMEMEELLEAGFQVDPDYKSYSTTDQLVVGEEADKFYQRSYYLIRHLLDNSKKSEEGEDCDILLVAHRATLDVATRQLLGFQPRTLQEMFGVLKGIPISAVSIVEQKEDGGGWEFVDSAPFVLRHGANTDFNAHQYFSNLK